jgi:hypothetical protein
LKPGGVSAIPRIRSPSSVPMGNCDRKRARLVTVSFGVITGDSGEAARDPASQPMARPIWKSLHASGKLLSLAEEWWQFQFVGGQARGLRNHCRGDWGLGIGGRMRI